GERLFEGACVEKLNIGLTTIPSFMIVYIEKVGEIELLDTVRTIETHAFYGIANGKLFLNDNVTDIDDYAFDGCEEVEKNVYNNCKFLGSKQNPYMVLMEVLDKAITHFETEDTTKFIYTNSFYGCFNLYSIVLNENLIHVSSWVFNDCKKLVEVYNLSNLDIRQDSYDNGCVGTWAFDIYDSKDAESKIFNENGFKVYHRDGYGYYLLSYEGADKAITMTYPDLVSYAFVGNGVIEEVVMREYWGTTIQEGAFMGCVNLKTVRICNCMKNIESFAFAYCPNLTNIIYDGTIAEWKSIRKGEGWNVGLKATYVQCVDGLFSITAESENVGTM
ncbi:MAG: leucine-rich repeat protein, partial [Clostridia bacterium]|nr:leucine-rich repeat protein [Clostridia bacterium]